MHCVSTRGKKKMSKVDEKKEHKRQNLLETAFSLFTTKGITKTSIAEIVEQAGVAKGTFYLYFHDKYDIEDKLIAYKANQIFSHAMTHSHYEEKELFEDKLIAIMDDILDQMQKNHGLLRFINKNLSWGIFRRAMNNAQPDILESIRQIMATDGTRWREPELMLYTIVELVGASCHSIILDNDPISLEDYKPYLYQIVRGIIATFKEN